MSRSDLLGDFRPSRAKMRSDLRELRQQSAGTYRKPYDLEDTLCRVQGSEHPLHLRVPIVDDEFARYEFYRSHFRWPIALDHYRDYGTGQDLWNEFVSQVRGDNRRSSGSVQLQPDSVALVTPGVRRARHFSESDAALGLNAALILCERWCAATPKEHFYSRAVSPYVRGRRRSAEEGPLEWAKPRYQVALAFAWEMQGRDLPSYAVEEPFHFVAPLAGNLAPRSMLEQRSVQITPRLAQLVTAAGQALESIRPELLLLLSANAEKLLPEDVASAVFRKFAGDLERYLGNGLNIDRVTEALTTAEMSGVPRSQALPYVCSIVAQVFGRKAPPWWFKEDFPLLGKEGLAGISLTDCVRLAESGGPAYQYALSAFRAVRTAPGAENLTRDELRRLTSRAARLYGIGDSARAIRVMSYPLAIAAELPAAERRTALRRFRMVLEKERPVSPLEAALHGPKAALHLPGLMSSMNTHLAELPSDLSVPALALQPAHIGHLAKALGKPLAERAKLLPGVDTAALPAPLLLLHPEGERALIAMGSKAESPAPSLTRPIGSYLAFYERLQRECRREADHVADIYFGFCAPKLPDPLSPPPGFLGLIEKFIDLRNPEWRFVMLEAPSARPEQQQRNKDAAVRKYMVLSYLLDAHLLGMLEWRDVEGALKWVTGGLPANEVKRLQSEKSWWNHQCASHAIDNLTEIVHGDLIKAEKQYRYWWKQLELARFYGAPADKVDSISARFGEHRKELQRARRGFLKRERFGEAGDSGRLLRRLQDPYPNEGTRYGERQSIDGEVSIASGEAQVGRMRALVAVLNHGQLLRRLFEDGVISVSAAGTSMRDLVRDAIANDRRYEDGARPAIVPASDRISAVGSLISSGVLDQGLIEKALASGNAAEQVEVTASIVAAAQRFESLLSNGDPGGRRRSFARGDAEEQRTRFFRDWEEFCRSCPFADPSGRALSRELFWNLRYSAVEEAIDKFRREVLPHAIPGEATGNILHEGDSGRAVRGATSTVATVAFAAYVLDGFEEHLENPRKVQQAGDTAAQPKNSLLPSQAAPGWWEERFSGFRERLPEMLEVIHEARRRRFLLGPVGGKIHVIHPIDGERLQMMSRHLRLNSSPFALIHASHSLLLPPVPTPEELQLVIAFLEREQLLDKRLPELQLGCSGRLTPRLCGVLGSSVLLSTSTGTRYNADSFSTNRNSDTGLRIMAYDANGPRTNYPFMAALEGRTDMLGRQASSDAIVYQLVHSVLAQGMTSGPLSHLARPFCRRHAEVLHGHGLLGVLNANWVKSRTRSEAHDASKRHYDTAIAPCVDAWFKANEAARRTGKPEGIIKDMHEHLDRLQDQVTVIQQAALDDPKYRHERAILFGKV